MYLESKRKEDGERGEEKSYQQYQNDILKHM